MLLNGGVLSSIDLASRSVLWQTSGSFNGHPAVSDSRVYVDYFGSGPAPQRVLQSYDLHTGQLLESFPAASLTAISQIVATPDTVSAQPEPVTASVSGGNGVSPAVVTLSAPAPLTGIRYSRDPARPPDFFAPQALPGGTIAAEVSGTLTVMAGSGDAAWINQTVAVSVPDTDADGLPDWWERREFGNLTTSAGGITDSDGDGAADVTELITGTQPASAGSLLRPQVVTGPLRLEWPSTAARRYRVQSSVNLKQWSDLSADLTGTGQTKQFPLPPSSGSPPFLRLVCGL